MIQNPQQTSYESPPSNGVPGCPCSTGPRLQGTNDGPWQESEGSQGMKIPSPSITFLFPLRNFAKTMHQKSKSTYWHTTTSLRRCKYGPRSFYTTRTPWFLVLSWCDEHESQPATGAPGSHWVPPRAAALVAFLRRFTLEKPSLELRAAEVFPAGMVMFLLAKIHRRYPKVIAEKLGTANIRIRAR